MQMSEIVDDTEGEERLVGGLQGLRNTQYEFIRIFRKFPYKIVGRLIDGFPGKSTFKVR